MHPAVKTVGFRLTRRVLLQMQPQPNASNANPSSTSGQLLRRYLPKESCDGLERKYSAILARRTVVAGWGVDSRHAQPCPDLAPAAYQRVSVSIP